MRRFIKYGLIPFMLVVLAAAPVSGVENEVDSLLKRMKDPNFEVKKQAIYYDLQTKHTNDPRLIPALFDVIKTDPDLKIKIMAVDKLRLYTKFNAVVEKLISLMDHETPEIREHAMRGLYGYGSIRKMRNSIANQIPGGGRKASPGSGMVFGANPRDQSKSNIRYGNGESDTGYYCLGK